MIVIWTVEKMKRNNCQPETMRYKQVLQTKAMIPLVRIVNGECDKTIEHIELVQE